MIPHQENSTENFARKQNSYLSPVVGILKITFFGSFTIRPFGQLSGIVLSPDGREEFCQNSFSIYQCQLSASQHGCSFALSMALMSVLTSTSVSGHGVRFEDILHQLIGGSLVHLVLRG